MTRNCNPRGKKRNLSVNSIPGIEEVNLIKTDGTVIHFNNPRFRPHYRQARLRSQGMARNAHTKIESTVIQVKPKPASKLPVLAMSLADSPSRIPIRNVIPEKREKERKVSGNNVCKNPQRRLERTLSPLEIQGLKAEKRAAWRQARLKSLEKDALDARDMIQSMNQMTDDLLHLDETRKENIKFPRIAIKSSPGAVIVREREKVVDEKITRRTEEVPCPITGQPKLRTVEYVEKVIETEVETCQEKIISLELEDPEKEDVSVRQECDADEESASIVTIRPNPDKLFLRQDSNENGSEPEYENSDKYSKKEAYRVAGGIELRATVPGGQNTEMISFLSTSPSSQQPRLARTIVEVVNPAIAGDGCPNKIAIGRSSDCSYPSFDDYSCGHETGMHDSVYVVDTHQANPQDDSENDERDHEEDDDDERVHMRYSSTESYSNRELSLNDKMKNVLQELLENERVKLNLSRSLIENDSSDPDDDEDNDETDDDERYVAGNAYFHNQGCNDSQTEVEFQYGAQSNGNHHHEENIGELQSFEGSVPNIHQITKGEKLSVETYESSLEPSDEYLFLVDGCRVYGNPNTELPFHDADDKRTKTTSTFSSTKTGAGTTTLTTTTTRTSITGYPETPGLSLEASEGENLSSVEKLVSQMHYGNDDQEHILDSGALRTLDQQLRQYHKTRSSSGYDNITKDNESLSSGRDQIQVRTKVQRDSSSEPDVVPAAEENNDDDEDEENEVCRDIDIQQSITKIMPGRTTTMSDDFHTTMVATRGGGSEQGDDDGIEPAQQIMSTTTTTIITTTAEGGQAVKQQTTNNQGGTVTVMTKKKKRKPKSKKK